MKLLTALGLTISFLASSAHAAKPYPFGIIRLFSTNVSQPGNNPAWTNPNIDGMRLRPSWQDVQGTSSTAYDWASIDSVFALAHQHNKTIGISVAAGVSTPPWVYEAGASKYVLHDGLGPFMPTPWDPVFLAKWKVFIQAMGHRYDANPKLGYVVISGLGQNVETYLSKSTIDNDMLNSLGGLPAWVSASKEIIAAYAEAFPTTPFFITAAKPYTSAEGLAALQEVVHWGVSTYPGRFGIMNASLNAQSNTGYYPNSAITSYHATQPTGQQMLCSASLDPDRLMGTLDQALTHGVLLGAKFIEVYQSDADKDSYQSVLASQRVALEGNARPLPPQNLQIAGN